MLMRVTSVGIFTSRLFLNGSHFVLNSKFFYYITERIFDEVCCWAMKVLQEFSLSGFIEIFFKPVKEDMTNGTISYIKGYSDEKIYQNKMNYKHIRLMKNSHILSDIQTWKNKNYNDIQLLFNYFHQHNFMTHHDLHIY